MNLKIITITALIILGHYQASAQSTTKILIGDTLPNTKIGTVINGNLAEVQTSDYKEKLLIIDFWSTSCSSCIEALPRMKKLQQKFANNIRILPVTYEKKDIVQRFLKFNKYTKGLDFPVVVNDEIFASYFKHKYDPHEVWIYKGKVVAITHLEFVDENNIRKLLNGENLDLPYKYDYYSVDNSKPIFPVNVSQLGQKPVSVKYAAICDFLENYSSSLLPYLGFYRDSLKKTIRPFVINQSIFSAYMLNWQRANPSDTLIRPYPGFLPNQIVWEVVDKTKYIFLPKKEWGYMHSWLRQNAICFEAMYPDNGEDDRQIAKMVIQDLQRLLRLNIRWQRTSEMVYVIEKKRGNQKIPRTIFRASETKYTINNLIYVLNSNMNNPYVFNESGELDSELLLTHDEINNFDLLKARLKDNGYDLILRKKDIDKLFFTEITKSL